MMTLYPLRAELQDRARVFGENVNAGIGQRALVPGREESGGSQHRVAILGHDQPVNRMTEGRSGGYAAAHAKDKHVLALRPHHERQVREKQLARGIARREASTLPLIRSASAPSRVFSTDTVASAASS